MPKRSAIHPTVIVVSARKRATNSNFPKSPLGRVWRSVAVHHAGMDLPTGLGARLAQRLDTTLAIRFVLENWLAPVATIYDVVDRPWIFNSQFARHAGRTARLVSCVNIKK